MIHFEEIFIKPDKFKITNRDIPTIYGIISEEKSPKQTSQIFAIKYYWNDIFQNIKYADDMDKAKNKLKDIIIEMSKKKIETSFENFCNF